MISRHEQMGTRNMCPPSAATYEIKEGGLQVRWSISEDGSQRQSVVVVLISCSGKGRCV